MQFQHPQPVVSSSHRCLHAPLSLRIRGALLFWALMIYITRRQALDAGMTHHGRIYGVPAWVRETPDGLDGAPKFLPLALWCWLADWLYEAVTWFMPADRYIEAPLRILRPIDGFKEPPEPSDNRFEAS